MTFHVLTSLILKYLNDLSRANLDITQVDPPGDAPWTLSRSLGRFWQANPSAIKIHQCPHCSYSTPESYNFKRHMLRHTGERPFTCPYCSYSASQKVVRSHRQTSMTSATADGGEDDEEDSATLQESGDDPLDPTSFLTTEMIENKSESEYSCSWCSYTAKSKASHIRHMRVHTGERPFACEHCPYRAGQRSTLQVHMRTHSKDKAFKCAHCPYQTTKAKFLTVHMRIHRSENKPGN
ncbi:hypothetical protein SK128_023854 [Halocaridina rubra]|uniref:Protein hunchback n=1 Tax=Halocaridina rubra TaxID=373956 RepID=A0AAN8XF26_HALRR